MYSVEETYHQREYGREGGHRPDHSGHQGSVQLIDATVEPLLHPIESLLHPIEPGFQMGDVTLGGDLVRGMHR